MVDIKHGYWAVNIHLDDRHYFAFYVPGIGQVQPTRISQGARTSSFTFNKLINIVLGPILEPQPELSLLHKKTAKDIALLAFYIDNIFEAFKTNEE